MTISTTSIKAVATGNSATTVWPFTFLIPNQASLIVSTVDVASGNQTTISPANYSVTGLGNAAGGSVTYPLSGSPLTSATQLVIQRAVPNTQSTSFINQGAAYPADIEAALDYLTMMVQQVVDAQSRSIVFSVANTVPVQLATCDSARRNLSRLRWLGQPDCIAGTAGWRSCKRRNDAGCAGCDYGSGAGLTRYSGIVARSCDSIWC
jgi:hypothetical protein